MTDQMIKNFEEENLIDTKQNWLVQGNLGWMNFEQQLFSWWPTWCQHSYWQMKIFKVGKANKSYLYL